MHQESKQHLSEWLRGAPFIPGVLVRGIRFADETFVCDLDSRDFPAAALEQAWRSVADTFQVLFAQRLPATQLTWVYAGAMLHCARRSDGAILGVFVSRKHSQVNLSAIENLLAEFRTV